MTTTDDAFIKAYSEADQESLAASRLPTFGNDAPVQNTFSMVVENVNNSHSVEVHHPEFGTTNPGPLIYVQQVDHGATQGLRPDESQSAAPNSTDQNPTSSPQRWRIDPTDITIPPVPHSRVATYQPTIEIAASAIGPAVDVEAEHAYQRQTQIRSRGLAVNWEVDHFHCPPICQRLQSLTGEHLYRIATSLLHEPQSEGTIAAITGVNPQEGRTTVLISLAYVAATLSKRIAMIDGHLATPDLGPLLGIQLDRGWESVSLGMPIGDAAVASLAESLILFPLGRLIRQQNGPQPAEGADSILKSLRENFDLVLLDAGPMFVAAHNWFNRSCAHLIDTAIILRDKRHVAVDQINDASIRIQHADVSCISVLENFT